MASVVMTARVDEEKSRKAKRVFARNNMTFTSAVNDMLDQIIENNGPVRVESEDDGKTPQERMLERMKTPENREKIRDFYSKIRALQDSRPLSKYDYMSKAEIAMEKAKARGVL